ncbi:MAG: hypothetical protein MZU84_05715 [Sphingobacterium sp.]|nr:hypothetical protein [Sphingobacterium sp.]
MWSGNDSAGLPSGRLGPQRPARRLRYRSGPPRRLFAGRDARPRPAAFQTPASILRRAVRAYAGGISSKRTSSLEVGPRGWDWRRRARTITRS